MRRFTLILLCIVLEVSVAAGQAPLSRDLPQALPPAHAHNDYAHPRPLLDALEHGFRSVEADIFLVDGELLVGHERSELRPDRTLQDLYLDPLRQVAESHDGFDFTLLIDIKSDAQATYGRLAKVLQDYRSILTEVAEDRVVQRQVTVIISGNRAWEQISAGANRLVGIDGRLSDLDSEAPGHLIPLISDHWPSHFTWNGQGTLPVDQQQKLKTIVEQAHAAGRRVRFWATPETQAMWQTLHSAGVDLINTDDLEGLAAFLRSQKSDQAP